MTKSIGKTRMVLEIILLNGQYRHNQQGMESECQF